MWNWINENSSGLNVFINIALCAVWLVYLQLLLTSYKRQRKSTIVISHVKAGKKGAYCLISNLSAETIHIHSLIVKLKTNSGDQIEAAITDPEDISDDNIDNVPNLTTKGPLQPGHSISTGRFENFIDRCLRESNDTKKSTKIDENDISELHLIVVAAYGSDNLSVAAERYFKICDDFNVQPQNVSTHQITSRKERKKIDKYLEKFI